MSEKVGGIKEKASVQGNKVEIEIVDKLEEGKKVAGNVVEKGKEKSAEVR